LADIIGVRSLINFTRNSHVSLTSDSQVALAVTRKWASKSPQIMALIRVFRQLCEVNCISLGLQYLPSFLTTWENQLSRSTLPETNAGSNIEKIICRLGHDLAASFMVLLTHSNWGPGSCRFFITWNRRLRAMAFVYGVHGGNIFPRSKPESFYGT
jgi:hypothetical protein